MSAEIPELSRPRRIHLVGAGGAGMGAIAAVLHAMGHRVSGSDLKDSAVAQRLRVMGVPVALGHDSANGADAELVAISTAVPERNPEVVAARGRGVPVLWRRDLLPAVAALRRTIVVAGTHGKTTTASMLAMVLSEAELRPSFIIGGDVNEIGSGAVWDDGDWFVIEGDESDRTFLALNGEVAVVTNIEPDHLEAYDNDPARLRAAFAEFSASADQRVFCVDDRGAADLAEGISGITYGTSPAAEYRLVDVVRRQSGIAFSLCRDGDELLRLDLPTPGLHNARNAAAATVAGLVVGAPCDAAQRALERFGGVARRFEFRGEAAGVTFVDDYAHLPTEVEAALAAARDGDWSRIVCVFQPHRYSRTAVLWRDFARSFGAADLLVVTEIYPAGETPRPGVSGSLIVDAVLGADPDAEVVWQPRLGEVADTLAKRLRPGDLCLTLGAGDLTGTADQVIARLSEGACR